MTEPAPSIPARAIIVTFVVMMLGASVFAWFVVRQVRRDAVVADRAVRVAGWSILAYADHEGRFPTDRAMLEAAFDDAAQPSGAATRPEWWTHVAAPPATAAGAWPTRFEDAGLDDPAALPRDLRSAMQILSVQFSADDKQPPRVGAGGRPTKLGTLRDVNGWLDAWGRERLR